MKMTQMPWVKVVSSVRGEAEERGIFDYWRSYVNYLLKSIAFPVYEDQRMLISM